jgi:sugar (pentulose or hexulose) kinase
MMVHESDVFTPDMHNHEIYNQLYTDVYEKLYPSLKESYAALCDFTRR